jgi:DNA-directed RNA polymerase specialized sigma24 family protein
METVFDQLDREWITLIRRPAWAAELAEACALAGAASPAALVPAMRQATSAGADIVLAQLARQADAGSAVAARALLQLLLPGTCRLAAKWWALGSAEDRAAAAVAAVFGRIRQYPINRRPTRIAANVLMDANHDLARAARCIVVEYDTVIPLEPEHFSEWPEEPEVTPADELRELIDDAVAGGRVPQHWAALIIATHIEGTDLPTIARRTGTPVRTLQWRRRHAEAALAAGVAA